jgi:hypothetical protein
LPTIGSRPKSQYPVPKSCTLIGQASRNRLAASIYFQHLFRIPRSARLVCVPGRVITGATRLHPESICIPLLSMPTAKHFFDHKQTCCWKRRRRSLVDSKRWPGRRQFKVMPTGSSNVVQSKVRTGMDAKPSYLRSRTALSAAETLY